MRTRLRRLAENGAVRGLVDLVERLDSSSPRVLRVLTYHRVDRPEAFAEHMRHVAERYDVVSAARVIATLEGGPPLPRRALLLTFDDAYRNFAEVAWPVMRGHGFPSTLFVPTAYPDGDLERFWWDRLAQSFRDTRRREPLESPVGVLPMATPEERQAAYVAVKRHVKDLAHVETLERTREVCAALGFGSQAHEVLGWDELRELAAGGVTIGAHTRTHPRLDRVPRDQARAEVLGSLADVEREVPGAPRVFAYPDGRFDDELVELLRAARTELAFTTRRGTNDVARSDRLRLRRINVDANDELPIFRAKLAAAAARLAPAVRLLDPPSAAERGTERAHRAERRRSQVVLRSLDAALTARLRSSGGPLADLARVLAPRTTRYERVGGGVRLAARAWPGLEERLARSIVETGRLPFRGATLDLAGRGSGATVFRLRLAGGAAWALKVYRRTLGRAPEHLAAAARRYRLRYGLLRDGFGEVVLPAHFLVLHGPLRGTAAVACLQPWLEGALDDLLARSDDDLVAHLRAHPALGARFVQFSRAYLAWGARNVWPDVAGAGNLCAVPGPDGPVLRLIDYGIFDRYHHATPPRAVSDELERLAARLERLLERIPTDVVPA